MGYFIWPTVNKRVTSKYGPRNLNIPGSSKNHKGIDVGGPAGNDIYAARSGTVTVSKTGRNGGRGYYVVVKHNEKYETLYQHCSKLLVSVGQHVSAGQVIAKVGSTGVGSGAHLHFEIHDLTKKPDPVYGNTVNPLDYVKTTDTLSNLSDDDIYAGVETSGAGRSTIIFIGDSRTVGMKQYVGSDNNIWSCKSGMGFSWMQSTGVPQIENKVSSDTAVCILMGINDMLYVSPNKYSSYINECASRWTSKGAAVYFVSVNPVRKSGYNSLNNDKIQTFNQNVRNGLSQNVGYIDTFSAIIDTFNSIDGLHYDKETSLSIYNLIKESALQGQQNMFANSAMIGGSPIQVDYTKLNPYVIRINDQTPASLDYSKLADVGVVGVYILAGSLYNSTNHVKKQTFKQKNFDYQRNRVEKANVEYGYFFHGNAQTIAEVQSEIYELSFIVRQHPPRLGVWVTLYSLSKNKKLNNSLVEAYQKQLFRLGLAGKIGIILKDRKDLELFDWDRFQEDWLLWIIDRVEDQADLQKLLDPAFFDTNGIG